MKCNFKIEIFLFDIRNLFSNPRVKAVKRAAMLGNQATAEELSALNTLDVIKLADYYFFSHQNFELDTLKAVKDIALRLPGRGSDRAMLFLVDKLKQQHRVSDLVDFILLLPEPYKGAFLDKVIDESISGEKPDLIERLSEKIQRELTLDEKEKIIQAQISLGKAYAIENAEKHLGRRLDDKQLVAIIEFNLKHINLLDHGVTTAWQVARTIASDELREAAIQTIIVHCLQFLIIRASGRLAEHLDVFLNLLKERQLIGFLDTYVSIFSEERALENEEH